MEKVVDRDTLTNYLESIHGDAKCSLNHRNDFELLISIVLSAQTTDESVNKVTPLLFSKYPTIDSLSKAPIRDVENIIRSIGLYKNKSQNIVNIAKTLNEDGYNYIPNDREYLMSLPGVGRKTTNVFLSEYYDVNSLGVDTHINRISKRTGIASDNDSVLIVEEKILKYLNGYSPKKFHHMMIEFGRNECKAQNPKCDECKVSKYCKKWLLEN